MLFKLSSMTFGLKVEPNVGWKLAADPRPTTLRSLKSTPSSRDWIFDCSFLRRKTNIRHHQKCWKKKSYFLTTALSVFSKSKGPSPTAIVTSELASDSCLPEPDSAMARSRAVFVDRRLIVRRNSSTPCGSK